MTRISWVVLTIAWGPLFPAAASAHAISGNVGIASATITLTGTTSESVTSNSKARYSFTELKSGSYVVTPSLTGYTFTPASQSVTLSSSNATAINFKATAVAKITSLQATPAKFTLTAAGATEQLQVEASYSNGSNSNVTQNATYVSNSTGVATVSETGLVTAKANGAATIVVSYDDLSSSVSATVAIATATYSISGNAGLASATVALTGTSNTSTTASSSGAYTFSGLPAGSYTITPSLSGYTFTPPSQSATITNANVSGVNFTAAENTHSVDLSWGAGTITDPSPGQVVVGYYLYRSSTSGGPYTQLNASPITALSYTDTAVSAGQTWYYVCSTVDNLGEVSKYSNQATATIP
jgi:hypothetical protein